MVLLALLGRPVPPARAVRLQHSPVACAAEGPSFSTLFSEALPHGRCVLVQLPQKEVVEQRVHLEQQQLPGDVRLELHTREVAHMSNYGPVRQVFFAGGRLALRRALQSMEAPGLEPMLPGRHGAPEIPGSFVGSISHTHGLAAALVSRLPSGDDAPRAVGIDVELAARPTSLRLARKILAAEERQQLGRELGVSEQEDLTLRFSLKEALYKAIHPLVEQSISWQSVLVSPRRDGSVELQLDELERRTGVRMAVEARWVRQDGFYVTTAAARALVAPSRAPARLGREEEELASGAVPLKRR